MSFHGSIKGKVLGILIGLMALALIVACGTSSPAPAADDTAPAPVAAPAVKDVAPPPAPKSNVIAGSDTAPKAAPTAVIDAEIARHEGEPIPAYDRPPRTWQ